MQSKKFTELKDHEIAILITALRDTALRYHDHQSLRERIAHLVVPALKGEGLPKEARIKDAAEIDGKEVPAVQSSDFEKLRNQWEDHMDNSFKIFESQLKNDWRDHIDSAFAKIEKMLLSARLHGFDAGRRVDGTNAASADKQQRPFPSRTAGEVESTTGFHVMESAGAKEVIDTLVADALMAASQGNASNVGDVLADSVERPDVDPIRHVSNDGQTGAN